jgi:hypothetical protein
MWWRSIPLFFSKGRVRPGVSHDRTQVSKIVPAGAKSDAIYRRYIVKFGRISGVMKEQHFTTRYREKSVWRRNRLLGESAYFKKWSYVKYCCELIKHATKNNLALRRPLDMSDEMKPARVPEPGPMPNTKVDGYSREELVEMTSRFEAR